MAGPQNIERMVVEWETGAVKPKTLEEGNIRILEKWFEEPHLVNAQFRLEGSRRRT